MGVRRGEKEGILALLAGLNSMFLTPPPGKKSVGAHAETVRSDKIYFCQYNFVS